MDTNTPQMATAATVDDLFTLLLVDGLPVTVEGREARYKRVRLRATNVADERAAQRAAERVVTVGGVPRLVASDAEFQFAMTFQHVEWLECDGQKLYRASMDLDLFGRLSSHDLAQIEQRVFLIELAEEVRYGNMSQADFDAIVSGTRKLESAGSPQHVGQAAGLGQDDPVAESGPALLADFAGGAANRPAAGHGG